MPLEKKVEKPLRRTFLKATATSGGVAGLSGLTTAQDEQEAGKSYEIRWTNGDGVAHAFTIIDGTGKWIASTDLAFGAGSTNTLCFTSVPAMN